MALRAFKKLKIEDRATEKFQDNVEVSLNAVLNKEILDGILIQNVSILTGVTNVINHKLDRIPLGYLIIRKRADSRIWDLQDANNNKTKTLSLVCSADVTIDIWVF